MTRQFTRRPTEAELRILSVLWEKGSATVREANSILSKLKGVGLTTTLKQMQIMTSKGLLVRDESRRPHIYKAAFPKDKTQGQLIDYLVKHVFEGSATKLVLQALRCKDVSEEECIQIEEFLKTLEGDRK